MCPYRLLYAPLAAFQRPHDRFCGCSGPREAFLLFRARLGDRVLVRF